MHPLVYIYFCLLIALKTAIHFIWQCLFIVIVVAIAFALIGCSATGAHPSSDAAKRAQLHFIGVPLVLAAVGSSTPYNASYSLTAAHVARVMPQLDVVAYHPYCDIALIRHRNPAGNTPADATVGQRATFSGYSALTMLPTQSAGIVQKKVRVEGGSDRLTCPAMLASAKVQQGMSGGAVHDSKGNLTGVIVGLKTDTREAVFVPLTSINNWILEHAQ